MWLYQNHGLMYSKIAKTKFCGKITAGLIPAIKRLKNKDTGCKKQSKLIRLTTRIAGATNKELY
jgi:CRISPR/Cas system-associated endonuclease/helicase Cas3